MCTPIVDCSAPLALPRGMDGGIGTTVNQKDDGMGGTVRKGRDPPERLGF